MKDFKFVTSVDDMERISRKDLGDNFDAILERVDKEDIGFVIEDEGKDNLVLIPARWYMFHLDDDFGCIVNSALRYAIGRSTYMPSVVCDFVRKYMRIFDTKTIDVMITDINRELENNIDQAELWANLRVDLINRQQEMVHKNEK